MFRRLETTDTPIRMRYEGREIRARAGESVAAALLAAGIESCRDHPKTGRPRAPFCLMGTCFECLVTIDGVPNRQACLVPAADGLVIERQRGPASPEPEATTNPEPEATTNPKPETP